MTGGPVAVLDEAEAARSERRLCGYILSGGDPGTVFNLVSPKSFTQPGLSLLSGYLQSRHRAGLPCDSVAVGDALAEDDPQRIVEKCGGWEGILELVSGNPVGTSTVALKRAADTVRRFTHRRNTPKRPEMDR